MAINDTLKQAFGLMRLVGISGIWWADLRDWLTNGHDKPGKMRFRMLSGERGRVSIMGYHDIVVL